MARCSDCRKLGWKTHALSPVLCIMFGSHCQSFQVTISSMMVVLPSNKRETRATFNFATASIFFSCHVTQRGKARHEAGRVDSGTIANRKKASLSSSRPSSRPSRTLALPSRDHLRIWFRCVLCGKTHARAQTGGGGAGPPRGPTIVFRPPED